MQARSLGSTGLSVTPVGLGLAALGRPAYINLGRDRDLGDDRGVDVMEHRCHAMLDVAAALGIRYVDAARSYGYAEAFLSSWLNGPAKRDQASRQMTIGSKWGYRYVGEWQRDAAVHETKDHSVEMLRQQIAESRELLGSRLQLYQIHSATLESGVLDDRRVLNELAQLRAGGLAVGLSVSGPEQGAVIRRALEVKVDGVDLFQTVQATWNLLEPSAGPALNDAKHQGWGVIIKEGVANGRLTAAGDGGARLAAIAQEAGFTVDAVALAAALAQPWADVVLSGAVTSEQLLANVRSVDLAQRPIDWPALAEPPAEYWGRRKELSWS
jgi:aryl-alcohol dehydrogenase-like predicted oxidoreductase